MSRQLRRERFSWDNPDEEPETVFTGWHDPSDRWNGFASPAFEKDEADRIMAWNQRAVAAGSENDHISYDAERDAYVITNPAWGDDEPELVHGSLGFCDDGMMRHLYGVGAWSWTWMEVGS